VTLPSLGPYTIEREVGRGGMGVVHLGQDPRLRRAVAIKVLPDAFTHDSERLARFEREARLLASLTHPNIAGIYGLEEADGKRFLVLEYVEGETLAERLQRGPLPLDEAIDVCRQIATALEAAHEAGIIHRDLKPGNVKLTPSGEVKVLDFGLAKGTTSGTESSADLSHSPTMTLGATSAGVILGTAAYMSPEQARGRTVDRRTDIWSFGCVLYECLTGAQAFAGETVSDMIALILQGEPDGARLPKDTPAKLRALLARCLEKDARQRLRDIGDARIELEELGGARSSSGSRMARMALSGVQEAQAVATTGLRRRTVPIALAAALLIGGAVVGALVWNFAGPRPADTPAMRFTVQAPPHVDLTGDPNQQAISPDGTMLVFAANDSTGQTSLWLRRLGTFGASELPGTRGAYLLFWSPDSRYVGFFADDKLKRIRIEGGRPENLCAAPSGRGASWGSRETIVFAPAPSGPLYQVRAGGGTPEAVTAVDSSRGETAHRWPSFLPDGVHFTYAALPTENGEFTCYVGSTGSKERKRLLTGNGAPIYASPGYLIYPRNEALLAQRFDAGRLALEGDPFTVGDPPANTQYSGSPGASVSRNGVLSWVTAGKLDTRLKWVDRQGRELRTLDVAPAQWGFSTISPDGRHALIEQGRTQGSGDLWVIDLEREVASRLTVGKGRSSNGAWSPDGREVAFSSTRNGPRDIYAMPVDGSGGERLVYASSVPFKDVYTWSPDGKWLVSNELGTAEGWNLYLLSPEGGTHEPFLVTPFNETNAVIAPNGHWIAYVSDESGTGQIYLQSFPTPGHRQQITKTGAFNAEWTRDGNELFVYRPDFGVESISITWGAEPRAGPPVDLFRMAPDTQAITSDPSGQRFLIVVPEVRVVPGISVAVNWRAGREQPAGGR